MIERILFGEQERGRTESERQRRRRVKNRIRQIENLQPPGILYGDTDDLYEYFTKEGYHVERIGSIGIMIVW